MRDGWLGWQVDGRMEQVRVMYGKKCMDRGMGEGKDLIQTQGISCCCCHSLCVCLSLYLILPSPSVSMGTGAREDNGEGGMGL